VALTKVGKEGVTGISNSSNATAITIDSSENVLVGKTASNTANAGIESHPAGFFAVTRDAGTPMGIRRNSDDGTLVSFVKDSTEVGTIGFVSTGFYIQGETDHSGFRFGGNQIIPFRNGADTDNTTDLGASGARFDDIFATNGTIQTSDQNEKQQIASLTAAEITAAKAISALFKTFKWKDKVEAKGDDARTHTGVIAQEVQTAMSNAGLDAADYAFWCSDTWTDDDGNSQTRMGIRYPELLAFVGAATEQRLANIETRLTALEDA